MRSAKTPLCFFVLFVLLCTLGVLSLSWGLTNFGLKEIWNIICGNAHDTSYDVIFFDIRLPRLLTAIFAGATLASAGAAMQSLFRNPLADPSITGVSSGAALGAVLILAFDFLPANIFAEIKLQIGALIFGLGATLLIWKLGRIDGRISALSMLLTGIAINAFCAAIVGFAMYTARDVGLKSFIFWSLGSLDKSTWAELIPAISISAFAWLTLYFYSPALNMLLLGSKQAYHSGVNIKNVQFVAMFSAAIMTASCVSSCGIIGFVGLVVPHILRQICGPDNRVLLPLSALGGAVLVVFSDIVSRTISQTDSVPIGVITSLLGAPIFLIILRRAK